MSLVSLSAEMSVSPVLGIFMLSDQLKRERKQMKGQRKVGIGNK